MDIGYGLGGAVWGIVIDLFNFQITYWGVSAVMLIGMAFNLAFFTKKKQNI
jgi:hypothetical protein